MAASSCGAAGQVMAVSPGRPHDDDAPGNVREGDQARHVETGQPATIVRVWAYGDDTCVTVQYHGRSHLDNGGAITWWQRTSAAVNARWRAGADFPGPVQAGAPVQRARSEASRPHRRAPHTTRGR